MARGIEGFGDDLRSPRLGVGGAASDGPGSYDRIVRVLRELDQDPGLLALLAAAWAERSFETDYARPLLLLAALRYRALETDDHPLGFELRMDAEAPELETRLREALADPGLLPLLKLRAVQTNEAGRAFAWGLPALTLGFGHRAFSLVDLGCSAGFNLVVDRTSLPYRFGVNKVTGFDFPSPEWRIGLDLAPIDAKDDLEARWLEACIWPGQPERLDRFKACRELYKKPWQGQAPAPDLRQHNLGEGHTRAVLEAVPGMVVAYESVVRPYLSPEGRARHDADMWAFLEADRNRLWAVLEPSGKPSTTPMTLTVHLVRGGERHAIELAQSGYHTSTCVISLGAPKQLVTLWNAA